MAYILTITNSDIEFSCIDRNPIEEYPMQLSAPDINIRATNSVHTEQYEITVNQVGGFGGIPEAPLDGKLYGRKNKEWSRAAEPAEVAEAISQTLEIAEEEIAAARAYADSVAEAAYQAGKQDLEDAQEIMEAVTERIDNRLTEVDTELTGKLEEAKDRIANAEENISDAQINIDKAEANITLQAERLDVAEGTLTDVGLRVDAAEGAIDAQATHIDTLEGTVSDVGLRLDAAEGTISIHNNRLDTAEDSITVMEQEWDNVEATITTTVATQIATSGSTISTGVEQIVDGKAGVIEQNAVKTVEENMDGYITSNTHFSQLRQDTEGIKATVGDATNGLVKKVSVLEQTSDNIALRVTDAEQALDDGHGGLLSVGEIKVTADTISSVVTNGDNYAAIIARINAATGASEVLLDADKIYLLGETVAERLTAIEAVIGNLSVVNTSVEGTIGSYGRSDGEHTEEELLQMLLDGEITKQQYDSYRTVTNWQLKSDGTGSLAKGNITWDTAGNASFTGNITASAGKIGGWDIINNYLHSSFATTSGNGTTHLSLHPGMESGQLASNNGIKSYTVVTTGTDPAPGTYTHYWLKADGSGEIANGSLTWSKYGVITLSNLNGSVILSNSGETLDQLLAVVSSVANMFEWDNDPTSSGYGSIRTKRVLDPITGKWTSPSFYTYGEITAGGVGSGGDTPSGALYSLVDVYHSGVNVLRADGTARQNGDALVFNTTQNKWVASAVSGGASSFSQLTGSPYDNTSLATALNGKVNTSAISDMATQTWVNGQGYLTGINFTMVVSALGYTPYNAANIGSASVNYANYAGYIAVKNNEDWKDITKTRSAYLRFNVYDSYNAGGPSTYGEVLEAVGINNHWIGQLWMGGGSSERLYYRNKDYNIDSWGSWRTVAWYSDIPTDNNQLTNGAGYITSSGSCAYATNAGTVGGYSPSTQIMLWSSFLESSADCDELVNAGCYRFGSTAAHMPSGGSYGNMLTVRGHSVADTLFQLYGNYDSDRLWFRSGTWYASSGSIRGKAWKEIYHSGNTNNTSVPWSCYNLSLGSAPAATNADLEVVTIGGQRYLHTHLPFFSDSEITAGGVGEGEETTVVTSFNGRSGQVTLVSNDVTSALGYTPYWSGNCNNTSTPWSCSTLTAGNTIKSTYSGPAFLAQTSAGAWSYYRINNSSVNWDIASITGTAGMLGQANALELRDNGQANGLAIRHNTSDYGKAVIVTESGEVSLGFWSTTLNPISGYPTWTVGMTGTSERLFGWYYAQSGGWKMTLDPSGNLVASGEITPGSDIRWKHSITPVFNGIDAIMKLQPSEWEWNSDNRKSSGLIAQQVQPILPHLIVESGGYLHLNYDGLHAYEISAIQSHETRIERLERENKELKMEIQRLRN